VPAFRETFRVFADANLSPRALSARLEAVAIEARTEAVAAGDAPPRWATFVDGRPADTEAGAHRSIEYQYNALPDVVTFALAFLRARSPVGHGTYRDSFYIGVDGRFVSAAQFSADSVPHTAEIVIGNTQPYSRKIDVQFNGTRALHFTVPAGLFDDTVSAVKGRFGNILGTVKRVYDIDFPGKYRLQHHQRRHTGKRAGRIVRGAGSYTQSPALVIRQV
jgi:hypothetical protein